MPFLPICKIAPELRYAFVWFHLFPHGIIMFPTNCYFWDLRLVSQSSRHSHYILETEVELMRIVVYWLEWLLCALIQNCYVYSCMSSLSLSLGRTLGWGVDRLADTYSTQVHWQYTIDLHIQFIAYVPYLTSSRIAFGAISHCSACIP